MDHNKHNNNSNRDNNHKDQRQTVPEGIETKQKDVKPTNKPVPPHSK